jgi:diacylglycerol kinase (ATP)
MADSEPDRMTPLHTNDAAASSTSASLLHRPKLSGLRRLLLAFVNSWKGFKGAFRSEAAFRQEVALALVLLPLGAWLGKTPVEKALLVSSVLLVLVVELLNTGIETVVDRIGLERHELSGLAKDVGSTAVLISFGVLAVVWGFLLLG